MRMTQSKLYSYFNYFFISIVLLWQPLQGTVINFDGKGRILIFFTIMSFIINCKRRMFQKLLYSKPIGIWLIWCVYVTLNTYIQGYEQSQTSFFNFALIQVFCPCMIMAVSAYEYIIDARKLLRILLWVFLIYAFIGTFVMDIGYMAEKEGAVSVNTLGNILALNVMMLIFWSGFLYCRKEMTLRTTIILILFAVGIIVVSATRKALGAGVIMIIALMLSQVKLTFNSFIKMIFPILILYYGFIYVMNNTQMGERLDMMEETAGDMQERYDIGDNFFLKAVGDRAPQYVLGTQLFIKNPINGIGLKNFPRKSGFPYFLHSEYMVQICECGIIGCILFVMFYVNIIRRLLGKYKKGGAYRQIAIMLLGTMVALLFTYLTAWTYSFPFYFVVLGSMVGFTFSAEINQKCIIYRYEDSNTYK